MFPFSINYQFVYEISLFYDLIYLILGIDNLSIFFIILVSFIMPFCFLYNFKNTFILYKEFIFLLFIIEYALFGLFLSVDLIWFFIFFEMLILPFFFIINIFGYRRRRNHAASMFVFYTLFGSILLLLGIIIIFSLTGTTDFRILSNLDLKWNYQIFLWFCFFFGLSIKVPIIPAHIWLPEAHVEAPTVGSVILASLLLKVSFYGFIRILFNFFPLICLYMEPLIVLICIPSVFWSSIVCLRQIDIKKIIAYSSVVHMNISLIGLFLSGAYGICGCILLSISHGFISGGLFFLAGFIYDRFNTRNLLYFGGLCKIMPLMSFFFFVFLLANSSFPGFLSFIGELFVLIGLFEKTLVFFFFLSIFLIIGTIYCIWFYDHLFNGVIKENIISYYDIIRYEFFIIFVFIFITLITGLFPNIFLEKLLFLSFYLSIN